MSVMFFINILSVVMLSVIFECPYDKCYVFIDMLNVIMPNVVMLSVVLPQQGLP